MSRRKDAAARRPAGPGWAALLGALAIGLGAAATVVDKRESLRWLWVVLIVTGALAGALAAVMATPWWQGRQDARAARLAVVARRERSLATHFEPRGRGVLPFRGRRGWYFTGRVQALAELAGWLAAPESAAVRVVTGAPGSGKSALLGRLVTLADPVRRREALAADPAVDPATLPPEGSIDLGLNAQGQTAQQLAEAIAAASGIRAGGPEELLAALEGRPRRLTLLIDGLDEATGPEELARLLGQLAGSGAARVLVGTRRHLVDRLVAPADALDLDDPAYLDLEDVAEYVRRCLLLDGDPQVPTPYRGRPALADQVATAVAERAGGNFLVAQLVGLSLVAAPAPVPVDQPGWQQRFPRAVGQAMREHLDGFGPDRSRVRDLLLPLAFAQGTGLADEELWAELATALGSSTYSARDVRWLLRDTSAANLLQRATNHGGDDGAVAWRLFHEALAEHLRERETVSPVQAERHVARVLRDRLPTRADRRVDWLAADAYTRTHLATHAAAAGRLDELVTDPGFLLVADPARLVRLLHGVTSDPARLAARVYQQVAHQLTGDRSMGQRASCLQRTARYCGADDLAEGILGLGVALPWTTRWARWNATGTFRQLSGLTGAVYGVAVGTIDGRPVVVAGGEDGTVRLWNARTGRPRGQPLTGHADGVRALAMGEVDGDVVIVTSDGSGAVRVWDARTGRLRVGPFDRSGVGDGQAVAVGEADGVPVIVSATGAGPARVWDARTGRQRAELPVGKGEGARVMSVAIGRIDGDPVIVAGDQDGPVWVWDERTGRPLDVSLAGHPQPFVPGVAVIEVDGTPVIVSAGGLERAVRVWDARTGRLRGQPLPSNTPLRSLAAGQIDGNPVIVAGGNDGIVRVWDARTGRLRGAPFIGHSGFVHAVAVGEIDGDPVVVSAGMDGTVRIWDARTVPQDQRSPDPWLTGQVGWAFAVAVGEVDGTEVVVSGDLDRRVWVWDAGTGQPRGAPFTGHAAPVSAVAIGKVDGAPVVVSGDEAGAVRVWDARTGRPRGRTPDGGSLTLYRGVPMDVIQAVAVGEADGVPVVTSVRWDGMVRIWDARTMQPRGEPLAADHNDATGHVTTVTAGELDGAPVLVLASYPVRVRILDAPTGQPRLELTGLDDADISAGISAAAVGELDGDPIVALVGYPGALQVCDARSGRPRGDSFGEAGAQLVAVAVGAVGGHQVIVSGGGDGKVRVWDPRSGRQMLTIETEAMVRGLACTAAGDIVAATGLGLAAFRPAGLPAGSSG